MIADLPGLLEDVHRFVRPLVGRDPVAGHIPAISTVDPNRFGIAVATVDGEVAGAGDWTMPFSVQSISKVFTMALVLARNGDGIWSRVNREPSGGAFNSAVQLELDGGRPRNPFINAGALVVTDELISLTDPRAALLDLLRSESGNSAVHSDPAVSASEALMGDRNASLAHLLASYGNLRNRVDDVLDTYFWQCALSMSCRDLALASRFLAAGGETADGRRLLSAAQTKRLNAVMLTCGLYDAAGEFAYRVGLPAKSGVGGGIVAVVPQRCVVCVWSPGLEPTGNSRAGIAALDRLTSLTGWSIF